MSKCFDPTYIPVRLVILKLKEMKLCLADIVFVLITRAGYDPLDKAFRYISDIEDITRRREDMNFIFEW